LGRVEFSPAGDRLITVSRDRTARLWSAEGKELQVLLHDGAVADATFSRDGGRIATVCSTGARLDVWNWDANSQEFVISQSYRRTGPNPEDPHLANLDGVAFSPDGRQLLITPRRGRAFLLTLEDDSRRSVGDALEYRAGGKATFSKVGDRILVPCLDGRVIVLQTATGVVQEFHGHETHATCASFSPSGERIVSASADGVICIWNGADGTLESKIRGHTGIVCSAVFSPFGDRILTGSADGTARTWLVDSEELIRLADSRTIRCFTPNELLHYQELLDVPDTEALSDAR
jgi:WD40 repeat protein